ncbi:dihydrodipicolinate synthase family protein [Mycobacterium tilburgii]|uniref:dihydrodipicolinate synthase family protein n=1 Tax=Mycobacterium tilburgii TaxID=44467 RepID=UPI0028C44C30|nr:dihydrodipicolinate synthase family protein [Mycobacterium tilburgii]
MVLPVSYWKLAEREIVQHYRSISDAVSIPIMVYNNTATSGVDITRAVGQHVREHRKRAHRSRNPPAT